MVLQTACSHPWQICFVRSNNIHSTSTLSGSTVVVVEICSAHVQDETAMLRRALKESMGRLASLSDEGLVQVDRRIVVKLLVTYFEKGQSKEVLQLMARILNFTGQSAYCLEPL